jgi:glucokinase
MAVIALDLGGTKLAGAVFDKRGRALHKTTTPLEGCQGRAVGELIRRSISRLIAAANADRLQVSAIGICVPGISHSRTGKVWAPNIPGWEDYPLRCELESAFAQRGRSSFSATACRLTVVIDSDRACCILGETWRGAAKGCQNAIFLAVGTGIGAGILCDGSVLRGAHDIAGAVGWLALDRPFRRKYVRCGCFEYHASGEGLAKVAKELLARQPSRRRRGTLSFQALNALTARDVFAAYQQNDTVARQVLAQAIGFWGMAVANLVSLFNPEIVVFGGGVFGPAKAFLGDILAEARKWAQPISIKQVKLRASTLGGDAGLYGAACLAFQAAKESRRRPG